MFSSSSSERSAPANDNGLDRSSKLLGSCLSDPSFVISDREIPIFYHGRKNREHNAHSTTVAS